MGSAARSHLRFLVASALSLTTVVGLVALAALNRPPGRSDLPSWVTEVPVRFDAGGTDGPPEGGSGPSRVVDVPSTGGTLLVTAPVGDRYSVRFATGSSWGEWTTLDDAIDDGPDLAATSPSAPTAPDPANDGRDPGNPAGAVAIAPGPRAEGPELTVAAVGPVRVPTGAERVEVVRLAAGSDANAGSRTKADQVTLTFLADIDARLPIPTASGVSAASGTVAAGPDAADPSGDFPASGTGTETGAGRPQVLAAEATAVAAQPAIVPRSSWATEGWASGNEGCRGGPTYSERIRALIVHHTVNANEYNANQVDDLMRAIYYAHVHVNHWCDIGYNFVVDRFGTIWEGRSGGIDRAVIGGHTKGFNSETVGVALLGQHQPGVSPAAVRPSTATAASVQTLAAWKLGLYGVDPSGVTWLKNRSTDGPQRLSSDQWHLVPTVMGHRDLGVTACPGDYGYEMAHSLIGPLTAARPADPPDAFALWAPYDHGQGLVTVSQRGAVRPAGSAALPGIGEATGPDPAIAPLPSPLPVAVAAAGQGSTTRGWVLHGDGVLSAFGGAPAVAQRPAGAETAVDVVAAIVPGASGGWVVSAEGGVHGFGGQSDRPVTGAGAHPVIRGDFDDTGNGYLVESDGHLRAVGAAPERQLPAAVAAIDVAVRPSGESGWVLSADGAVHAFGGAPAAAISSPGRPPAGRSYRAVAASASGRGGWIMTDDGQLWPFNHERLILPVATDKARADVVDVAMAGAAPTSGYLARSDPRWLIKAVRLFLGRDPSAGELDFWDGRLTYEGGRMLVTDDLARSDEWAGARIDQLYQDVLGRGPDGAGRRYWLEQVRAGLGLQHLGIFFYGSTEYVATSGSDQGYVQRLYQVILGRSADPDGLAYWVGQLGSGRTRPVDVAAGFYQSPESRTRRVDQLYGLVLGRPADAGGRDYWVQRLLGTDDVELAAELAASDEFYVTAG